MRMPLMFALILMSLSACSRQSPTDETAWSFSKDIDYAAQSGTFGSALAAPDWLKKNAPGQIYGRKFSLLALKPSPTLEVRPYTEREPVLAWYYRLESHFQATGIPPAKVYWLIRAAAAEYLATRWPCQSGDEKVIIILSGDIQYTTLSLSEEKRKRLLAEYRDYESSLNDNNRFLPVHFSKRALREQLRDLEEFMNSGYDGELLGDLHRCRAELEGELQSSAPDQAAR